MTRPVGPRPCNDPNCGSCGPTHGGMTITINQDIKLERISDLLATAFESGISYWASWVYDDENSGPLADTLMTFNDGTPRPKYTWLPFTKKGAVVLTDKEAELGEYKAELDGYRLGWAAIRSGLKNMAELYPNHMADFLAGNEDATTGDVFIQCCIFGEIIYGEVP